MSPALRLLEEWTTHQDYLWFLALLAWGGVLGAEWRRRDEGGEVARRGWLVWLAISGIAGALLELVLLAQDIQFPYLRLDAAMGTAQGVGVCALAWGATENVRRQSVVRAIITMIVAGVTVLRIWRPVEGGAVLALIQAAAVVRILRRNPRPITPTAGVFLAIVPIVATYGPWAYAINHGRRMIDWSYFSLPAAGTLLASGALIAAAAWRRRLQQAMPEAPRAAAALRRDLRRALMVLGAWLFGGVLLAVWYGRHARQAFEENLLRRMETAVLALDSDVLVEAFGPALRVEGTERKKYPDGTPVEVAITPRTGDAVYAKLRTQLARIREQNPDFFLFYIMAWRQGYLLEFASERRLKEEPMTRVINRRVTSEDLLRLAARQSFLEGPQWRRWEPTFSAQTPLKHPSTGQILGWLVADIEAGRWLVTFAQARLQTMALVGAGVGLWTLAVAYRLRRESRDAAEQKAAASAAADRMKSAFLAKVSHELRTPIQSVLGYGELLAGASLSDAQRGWLKALQSHGDIMLRLVNDLIDLGALQSGAFQFNPAPLQLKALVDGCVASLQPAATEKGLALRVEVAPGLPECVVADGVRLRQILLNLLTNAIKFTSQGQVSLRVNRVAEERLEFVVRDTGPGFPDSLRSRLFQPFTRLDPASGGSGLGLALVHGLCAAMGGTVRLDETERQGASFVVQLPLPTRETGKMEKATVSTARRLNGLRVVVAEDNTLVRELLVAFLSENGASVTAVGDGLAALEAVREKQPDALLLDIALPEMDGIAVAKTLRAPGATPILIIGLSAHAGPHDESTARAAGMDEFFTKPVSLARLGEALAQRGWAAARNQGVGVDIVDEQLRARLLSDFVRETPRIIDEMRAALLAQDWPGLRNRAHYLKNSADVLRATALQQACHRLASFDDHASPTTVQELFDAVVDAVPEKAFDSAETASADV